MPIRREAISDKEESRKNFMLILSAAIIRCRYIIFLLFTIFENAKSSPLTRQPDFMHM